MNVSTNETESEYLIRMRTIAGSCYITVSFVGLFFVTFVHLSMRLIKEAQLKNCFYYYSSQCLLCDELCLLGAIYLGLVLVVQNPNFPPEILASGFSLLFSMMFDLKSFFLVMVCWSRFKSFKSNSIVSLKAGKFDFW